MLSCKVTTGLGVLILFQLLGRSLSNPVVNSATTPVKGAATTPVTGNELLDIKIRPQSEDGEHVEVNDETAAATLAHIEEDLKAVLNNDLFSLTAANVMEHVKTTLFHDVAVKVTATYRKRITEFMTSEDGYKSIDKFFTKLKSDFSNPEIPKKIKKDFILVKQIVSHPEVITELKDTVIPFLQDRQAERKVADAFQAMNNLLHTTPQNAVTGFIKKAPGAAFKMLTSNIG